MTIDEMVAVIAAELTRQAREDGMFSPYVDVRSPTDTIVDGHVDIRALAEAIVKAEGGAA